MSTNKRILIVILIIFTLLLAGLSFLVSQSLSQQGDAQPIFTSTKFAVKASKEFYANLDKAFATGGCTKLFSENALSTYAPSNFSELSNLDPQVIPVANKKNNPLNCSIFLADGKAINLSVYTYDETSILDPNEVILSGKVNDLTLSSTLTSGGIYGSTYYFGTSTSAQNYCTANIFNKDNRYNRIELNYFGFAQCADAQDLNSQVAYVVTRAADGIVNSVEE